MYDMCNVQRGLQCSLSMFFLAIQEYVSQWTERNLYYERVQNLF